jgi:hypothetical protein
MRMCRICLKDVDVLQRSAPVLERRKEKAAFRGARLIVTADRSNRTDDILEESFGFSKPLMVGRQ